MSMKYDAEIYYTDGSNTVISELTDNADGLRKAFKKRQRIEVKTGTSGYQLIDMQHVHNIRLTPVEATS